MYLFAGAVVTKYHKWGVKMTEISSKVLEARSPKCRCQQGHPSEGSKGGGSFLASSCPLVKSLAFLDLQLHNLNLCLHLHMAFFPVSPLVFMSVSLNRPPSLDLGPTLIQYDLILT